MRLSASGFRFAAYIPLLCLFTICAASYADGSGPKRELVWSQAESEISTPQFSDDGNFIVLVTRIHWADGHEAEDLPEDYFTKLERRKQEDPRFADPIIRFIDLKGNPVCEIRYGASPIVSSDNKTVVFSRQKKPLTGLRTLAETLGGNDIQTFDCEKKQGRTIAQPDSGYLDNPIFLRDKKAIAYTRNEATNGAFGGPVGLEEVDLSTGQKAALLGKQTTPAVPCPKEPSKSPVEAFMCAHVRPSAAFPNLLLGFARTTNELLVLLGKPVPSPGDSYLAQKYDLSLVSASASGGEEILSLGRTQMQNLRDISIQESSGDKVLVRSKHWRVFSVDKRAWLPDALQRNTNPRSLYSPNLDYYLTAEPAEEPNHFTLRQASNGQVVFASPMMEAVYDAAWSRDSKRFLIVGVPRQASGSSYHEELAVYLIP
jgi:hypothetical protein